MRTKSKLGNPALIAAAASAKNSEASKQAATAIPFLIKGVFIIVGGVVAYRLISTGFKKMKEVSSYPAANISMSQAKSRAESIYKSLGYFGIGNDFDTISTALGNLNYNGFVRVYNAFNQKGNFITGYSDMIQLLNDKLSNEQILQLRFLLGGAFFKTNQVNSNPINEVATKKEVPLLEFSGV